MTIGAATRSRHRGDTMKTRHIENPLNLFRSRTPMLAAMALVAALVMPTARAQSADVSNVEVGHSTAAWFELQSSNAQAAPPQPMLGAEAGYAWQRYMNSFTTPIPNSFGSAMQASGGQGNSLSVSLGGSSN
jgi:hypothetical protein